MTCPTNALGKSRKTSHSRCSKSKRATVKKSDCTVVCLSLLDQTVARYMKTKYPTLRSRNIINNSTTSMLDERTHRQSNEFTVQFFQTFELEISPQLLCGCLRGAVRTAPTLSTGSNCRHLFVVGVFVKSWVQCIHVMNVDMRSPLICTRQHAVSTSFLALSQRSKPEFFTVRIFWSMAGSLALTSTKF